MATLTDTYVQQSLLPAFGRRFLNDHAGSIISDPKIAIIELVANSWDAGADTVKIRWFPDDSSIIEIDDNGTGMTPEEFTSRWTVLSYNRIDAQGIDVSFPADNQVSNRKAFGRNGKGRHGMFCFADEYTIETKKDGIYSRFKVKRTSERGPSPFEIQQEEIKDVDKDLHGTKIWAESLNPCPLDIYEFSELIGSKFIADPTFKVFVNDSEVELTDLTHLFKQKTIKIDEWGEVKILLFDTQSASKTTKQHGVAWWVNNRLVGNPDWNKLNGGKYLDGRATKARTYTFIVEADVFDSKDVLPDWSGFHRNRKVQTVASKVEEYITEKLHELLHSTRKARKQGAVENNLNDVAKLSPISRQQIGEFLDNIQVKCPTIQPSYLTDMVAVMAKLEQARSGYSLLQQLSKLTLEDVDSLNDLLNKWSVQEARVVLDELYTRLALIEKLETLVEDPNADELHEIHPLFERALWIFGPEYESVEYTSNRALLTVMKTLFRDRNVRLETPRRRPDIIVLPDSSVGIYACDSYDEHGEIEGIRKVLIVELKRGGFSLTRNEVRQAEDYEIELRKSNKISDNTSVIAFVLGASLRHDAREPKTIGNPPRTFIYPKTYNSVLRQAHARTFFLKEKIQKTKDLNIVDEDIEEILSRPRTRLLI